MSSLAAQRDATLTGVTFTADAIRLDRVTKIYGEGEAATIAVDEVSCGILRGSWTAVMGASGHGKSTLLQLMGGLDRPSAGTVVLDGIEITALRPVELAKVRARKLGFVFQFFNLLPHLTAVENVGLALWFGGRNGGASAASAVALLDRVGLADKAHHLPSMLSGGQQQRVAIARALANDPALLLMDEPTGNLDSTAEAEMLGLLNGLHRDEGRTIVVVTHSDEVARHAERVIYVRDGRITSGALC
ncbi:MAG: ABC transporter ATP-binding protein [Magnetospirillum sp.]|nr:ABC transporter ATP-binding protein [Magnetospirillum sp.]